MTPKKNNEGLEELKENHLSALSLFIFVALINLAFNIFSNFYGLVSLFWIINLFLLLCGVAYLIYYKNKYKNLT